MSNITDLPDSSTQHLYINFYHIKKWAWIPTSNQERPLGTSLVVRCLRLRASNAGGEGSIPGRGTKIPHALWRSQKKKKKDHWKVLYLGHLS